MAIDKQIMVAQMGTGFYKYKRPVNNKPQFFSSTKELTQREKIHTASGFDVPQRLKNFCTQKPFCLYTRAKDWTHMQQYFLASGHIPTCNLISV
jgi:hypothetical protein